MRTVPAALIILMVSTVPAAMAGDGTHLQPRVAPPPPVRMVPAAVETLVVDSWTFDGAGGIPDPQGWTIHDRSADLMAFFHVADATELDGGDFGYLSVLEGNQSLWCGATYDTHPELCNYASLPGYGQAWNQAFVSRVFTRSGDVGISYLTQYDNEPGYDFTTVYCRDQNWEWYQLDSFAGQGAKLESIVVPDSIMADSVQFAIWFTDLSFWNDETGLANLDGAVIFDSLTIWDGVGTLDFEDFEDEAPGLQGTSDGDWTSYNVREYGVTAALFDGATVLQEDSLVSNITNLWGFFSGSTVGYGCGGHPEQAAVPYGRFDPVDTGDIVYLHNEIWSPVIDWTKDKNGTTIGSWVDGAYLEFDVYRELALYDLIFYTWAIREVVDGCGQEWQSDGQLYFGAQRDWLRQVLDISPYVSPLAQEIQVSLGVRDMCLQWCGIFGYGECHSQAPLFDNVRLVRVGPVASSAGDAPSLTSLGEAYPNPFNPSSTIPFTLAEPGRVRIAVYDVSGRLVRTLVDGNMAPGSAHAVDWDGLDANGNPSASGVYFVRLTAGSLTQSQKITLLK